MTQPSSDEKAAIEKIYGSGSGAQVTWTPLTRMVVRSIEVVQTIQDPANSVKLIAEKRTIIRLFFNGGPSRTKVSDGVWTAIPDMTFVGVVRLRRPKRALLTSGGGW